MIYKDYHHKENMYVFWRIKCQVLELQLPPAVFNCIALHALQWTRIALVLVVRKVAEIRSRSWMVLATICIRCYSCSFAVYSGFSCCLNHMSCHG